jgi:hypothetical protein
VTYTVQLPLSQIIIHFGVFDMLSTSVMYIDIIIYLDAIKKCVRKNGKTNSNLERGTICNTIAGIDVMRDATKIFLWILKAYINQKLKGSSHLAFDNLILI